MRFGVLGPLLVRDAGGTPIAVPEAKVRALLADLLVHEGRPVSADRLIEDLWGDAPPGRPANALQAKVSQLRRAIGRERVTFQASGYRLVLDPASDEVDADRFAALAAEARSAADPRTRAALLTEALELWRGPAYADVADEEFARAAAQRLTEQRLSVLEEQAEARLDAGDRTLLAGDLADLVARHPLRERLRAVQLRALYLAGRQSEALASYADLRERLADELGVDPSPELAALHQAILRQDASLGAPASPSVSGAPAGFRSNLPAQLTELIGRDEAMADVDRLLRTARLVTLTGPGGVGKTRLAVECASRLDPATAPDGVWLVELGSERGGAADLAQVVADVLGLRDDTPPGLPGLGASGVAERLATVLRDRRGLLVLDNCEHLVEPAAELAGLLLRTAPGLRVLATSREPLGIAGETVVPVEPLAPSDAMDLFAERAAAAGLALDGTAREAAAEIVRRLDGIPLALELAATRVRGLGVHELAARLEDRLAVLTSGRRGAPARQRTLQAVIDWSWDLLGAAERTVLRRLAVHADGCALDAAEAVCAGGDAPREAVFDLVGRLVDRSLVVLVQKPAGPRYRLLESVAAYALDRLREAGDLAATRDRHLRHYLDLAERAEDGLRGPDQRAWLVRLDAEAANFRAALRHAPPDEAARLATALSPWWLLRGRLTEAHRTLSDMLAAAPGHTGLRFLRSTFELLTSGRSTEAPSVPSAGDPLRRGRLLWSYAYGLFNAGELAASEEANAQARDLLAGDAWGTAAVLALSATHALARGDLTGAERDGLRGAALFRELGDRWGELQAVAPLSALAAIRGDYAQAASRQEEGLRIARELGLATEVSARLSELGRLALLSGDVERARDLHETALRLAAEQGFVYGEVHALMGLALGARRSGDLDAAEAHLLRLRDDHPSSQAGEHLLHAELGFVAELRGDGPGAAAHQLRGLEVALSIAEPRAVALSLEGLAGAAALLGDPALAALLLGAADAARRGAGVPLPPAERGDVDRISAAIASDEDAFAAAFRRGADIGPQDAARLARETLGHVRM
ncbi:BTAD domain-containing putative transcriptional regulator [Actinomadura fibrosa]|uniref:BTAD domain-containing putative transcriptional regulator n=1 Tax=Actinomadura fibrosa TaxID=111802 RepID=A0ABW2XHI6_9ACTN|nr:BTAD domain-containing putative transcriptional regulator [Actinomadura fibrosa]